MFSILSQDLSLRDQRKLLTLVYHHKVELRGKVGIPTPATAQLSDGQSMASLSASHHPKDAFLSLKE